MWPHGWGVNDYIKDDLYDDMYYQLKYPTVDHIVQTIQDIGPSALLMKVDLKRAYRNLRIDPADYPLHRRDYWNEFKLYLAVCCKLGIVQLDSLEAVSVFLEYLIRQGLRATTLQPYVLKHYFELYDLNVSNLKHRRVKLALKSVAHNAPLVKSIFSVTMLEQLVVRTRQLPDGQMFAALYLMGFFGFF